MPRPRPAIDRAHVATVGDGRCNAELRDVLVSVSFWFCLLLAGITYAASMLSARYVENQLLAQRYVAGDVELKRLVEQVDRYERFCEQLARPEMTSLPAARASRAISIDGSLQFRIDDLPEAAAGGRTGTPGVSPVLNWLSRSPAAQRMLMAMSAVLVVAACSMLIPSQGEPIPSPSRYEEKPRGPLSQRLQRLRGRYRAATGE